jgi:hypothetical protein
MCLYTMDLNKIFDPTYCNFLLNVVSDYIYETKDFTFFDKQMPKTMHSAKKIAKYYIKCVQIKSAIHFITSTPYLDHYTRSLQLLDTYGAIHQDLDRASILAESDTLLESYISSFTELDHTIKTYHAEFNKMPIGLNKLSFKGINQLCIRVKEKIKEFHSVREKLFQTCLHLLEALVEQHKLEKIINKIKELEAKKLLK